MDQHIKVERRNPGGQSATVTINRPDKRNALNQETVVELSNALDALADDERVRVVVLTGAGAVFSAGADLDALRQLQSASREHNLSDSRQLAGLLRQVANYPKPVVARVNGHAIAGGAGLMAACDFVVASEDARFGFTEVRIGFVPAIVTPFVARRMRGADIRDLFLTGRLIDAAAAVRMGLVNEAVPAEELDLVVDRLVDDLCHETSPEAVAHTKKLLLQLPSLPLDEALEIAVEANADARSTSDCREGIAAFLEKRSPRWKETEEH